MPVIVGDTFSAQSDYTELTTYIAAAAEALMPEFEAMQRLVTRVEIPRGHNSVRIPFQNSIFAAQPYTDDDEISVSQRFSLDTLDLTINMLHITYRITERATRLAWVDLGAMAGEELARARNERLEADLLFVVLTNAGLTPSTGATGLTLAGARTALQGAFDIARDPDGGPIRNPFFFVVSPESEFKLYSDLGAESPTASFPHSLVSGGKVEDLVMGAGINSIENAYVFNLLGSPVFRTGYINQTVAGVVVPQADGALFSKRGVFLGVSKDWDLKTYDESKFPGLTVRSMADYGQRLGPFTKWTSKLVRA